jgi:hypothetical protein
MEVEGQQKSIEEIVALRRIFESKKPTQAEIPTREQVLAACSELIDPEGEFLQFPKRVTAEYIAISNAKRNIGSFLRIERMLEFSLRNENHSVLSMMCRYIFCGNAEVDDRCGEDKNIFNDLKIMIWGLKQYSSTGFNPIFGGNCAGNSNYNSGVSYEAFNQETDIRLIYEGVAQESILLQQKVIQGTVTPEQLCQISKADFIDLCCNMLWPVFASEFYGSLGDRTKKIIKRSSETNLVLAKMFRAMQQGEDPQQVLVSPEDFASLMIYYKAFMEMFESFTLQQRLVVIALKEYCCKVHERVQAIRKSGIDDTDPIELLKMIIAELFKNFNGKTVNVYRSRLIPAFIFQLRRLAMEREEALRALNAGEQLTDRQQFVLSEEATEFFNLCWNMCTTGKVENIFKVWAINDQDDNETLVATLTLEELFKKENEIFFQHLLDRRAHTQFLNLEHNLETRLGEFRALMPETSEYARSEITKTIFRATDYESTVGWLKEINGRLFRSEIDNYTGAVTITPVVLDAAVQLVRTDKILEVEEGHFSDTTLEIEVEAEVIERFVVGNEHEMLFDGDHVDVVALTVCHKDGNPKEYLYSRKRGFMHDRTHEIPVGAQAEMYRKMIFSGRAWDSSISTNVRVVHRAHETTKAEIAEQNDVLDAQNAELVAEKDIALGAILGKTPKLHESQIKGNDTLRQAFPLAFATKEKQREMIMQSKIGFDKIRNAKASLFDAKTSHGPDSLVMTVTIPDSQRRRSPEDWFSFRFEATERLKGYVVCAIQVNCPFLATDPVLFQLKSIDDNHTISILVQDVELTWNAKQYISNVETQVIADEKKGIMSDVTVLDKVIEKENAIKSEIAQLVRVAFGVVKSELDGLLVECRSALSATIECSSIERLKILSLLSHRIANYFNMLCSNLPVAAQLSKSYGNGFVQCLPINLMRKFGKDMPKAMQTLCEFSDMFYTEAVRNDDDQTVEHFMCRRGELTEEIANEIFSENVESLRKAFTYVGEVFEKDQSSAIDSFSIEVSGACRSYVTREVLLENSGVDGFTVRRCKVEQQLRVQFTSCIFHVRKHLIEMSDNALANASERYENANVGSVLLCHVQFIEVYYEARCLMTMFSGNRWSAVMSNELIIERLFGSSFLAAFNKLRNFAIDVSDRVREKELVERRLTTSEHKLKDIELKLTINEQREIEQALITIKTAFSTEMRKTDDEVKSEVESIVEKMTESSKDIIDRKTERSLLEEANGIHHDDEVQREAVESQARQDRVNAWCKTEPESKPKRKRGWFHNLLCYLRSYKAFDSAKTQAQECPRSFFDAAANKYNEHAVDVFDFDDGEQVETFDSTITTL